MGVGGSALMLHPLLEAVFEALDEAGVTWCLLRLPSNPSAERGR